MKFSHRKNEKVKNGVEKSKSPKRVSNQPRKIRLWTFRLLAATLIPVLFFGGIELVVRFVYPGYPVGFIIPAETDPESLVDNYKFSWRFFPRALGRSSQPILVKASKNNDTKRVIVFGGSAAMGDPEPAYGFPRVLQTLLEVKFPDQKFEVINAAVTAVNSHVVLPIAKDCRKLNADAWILYMGNNEVHGPFGNGTVFGGRKTPLTMIRWNLAFQKTRTGQFLQSRNKNPNAPKAWGGLKMFLDQTVRFDDPSLNRVYENFEANVSDILDMAIRDRTPIIISTVVSNLADNGPFVSVHDESLSQADLAKWETEFEIGCDAQNHSRFADAIAAFEKAEKIDAHFAELQYRLGHCRLALGDANSAKKHFVKARDFDALRFRADSRINQILRDLASKTGDRIYFVDAEKRFAEESANRIVGERFLYEHVHFKFEGNYLLAKLATEQLVDALDLDGSHVDNWPSLEACAKRLGFTPYHHMQVIKEVQTRLRAPPFNGQINRAERMEKLEAQVNRLFDSLAFLDRGSAIKDYEDLIAQKPNDWVLRKQFSVLLELSDLEKSAEQWRAVTKQMPHYAQGFFGLGAILNRAKKREDAEIALRQAIELRPNFPTAYNSLGICLSHQKRFDESYQMFQKAVELRPDYAEAYVNWGMVLANQKQTDAALNRYRDAHEVDENYLPAIEKLGKHYVEQKDFASAEPYYAALVRLLPEQINARLNYGRLLMKMGRKNDAAAQLHAAAKIDPTNAMVKQALRAIPQ